MYPREGLTWDDMFDLSRALDSTEVNAAQALYGV